MVHSNGGLKFENTEDIGEKFAFFKRPPYGQIFKILFHKDSSPQQSTSYV